ncbi:MAG TPA: lysophospholipid acyltransferase family protein [Planctomycetota bacterium]
MDGKERPRRLQGLLDALVGAIVPLLLRLLVRTWSVRVVNRDILRDYVDAGRPLIVATWHQMILPGVAFFRDRRAYIMVSKSRDGELIARVNLRMGFRNVRGSSSRGGGEALLAMIDVLRGGAQGAMMVDGPRGPAREPKSGCVVAAAKAGAPLIPLGCRARPAILARNWDRTLIPLPFARVVLCFGEPLDVPPEATPEEIERFRLKVREGLLAAEDRAERFLAAP